MSFQPTSPICPRNIRVVTPNIANEMMNAAIRTGASNFARAAALRRDVRISKKILARIGRTTSKER
jgi:hypothetical protein